MTCNCEWNEVLRHGCSCGAFASEKKAKEEGREKIKISLCSCKACVERYQPTDLDAQISCFDCHGNRISKVKGKVNITNIAYKELDIEIKDRSNTRTYY